MEEERNFVVNFLKEIVMYFCSTILHFQFPQINSTNVPLRASIDFKIKTWYIDKFKKQLGQAVIRRTKSKFSLMMLCLISKVLKSEGIKDLPSSPWRCTGAPRWALNKLNKVGWLHLIDCPIKLAFIFLILYLCFVTNIRDKYDEKYSKEICLASPAGRSLPEEGPALLLPPPHHLRFQLRSPGKAHHFKPPTNHVFT